MQLIPLTNDFGQNFTTVLNGQSVAVRVWYQEIGDGWFISMAFTDGDGIVNGHRINTGSPIMASYLTPFIGEVICLPTIEKTAEPGRDQPWGNTHRLVYLTEAEALEAGIGTL